MKVLLVSVLIENSPQAMPLATGLLKAFADRHSTGNFEIVIIEASLDENPDTVIRKIASREADWIGVSLYVWNQDYLLRIIEKVRTQNKFVRFFAGGPQAGAQPESLLATGFFEFLIRGEGEESFLLFLNRIAGGKDLRGIPGLVLQGEQEISQILPASVSNLDTLVSPFLSGAIDVGSYPGVLWELSRGCVFRCTFCYEGRGIAGVRTRSPDTLIPELELFSKANVSQIFILDPTFNQQPERAKEILRLLAKHAPEIHYSFEVRTEFLDEEMIELFSVLHCSLQIGLESASEEVVRNVGRSFNRERYESKIRLLNEYGIVFGLDLIYGLPGDTPEIFFQSLDFAIRLQPNHLDLFPLAVLPGTDLYEQKSRYELESMEAPPYRLIRSPGYEPEELEQVSYFADSINIFYNKGGAVGWLFMILETLEMTPSSFFKELQGWLVDKKVSIQKEINITDLQVEFVRFLFLDRNRVSILFPLEEVIRLHGAFRESLRAGYVNLAAQIALYETSIVTKAPGTIFLNLNYNPDELLQLGEYNLEEFLETFDSEAVSVIVYNHQGEVRHLIIDSFYANLLQETGQGIEWKHFPERGNPEVYEWVRFSLEEGIVCLMSG